MVYGARVPLRFPNLPPHFPLGYELDTELKGTAHRQLIGLRGYRQVRNYSCGFASAWMVAKHFRPGADPRSLFDRLGTSRDGTRQTAIVRELRSLGLSANVRYDIDLRRIRIEIDRGKPIIGYLHDDHHWIVIYGYATAPDHLFIADPHPGEPSIYPWKKIGRRLGRFGIVCADARAPAQRKPVRGWATPVAASPPAQVPRPVAEPQPVAVRTRTGPPILLPPSRPAETPRSLAAVQATASRGDRVQLGLPLGHARSDER